MHSTDFDYSWLENPALPYADRQHLPPESNWLSKFVKPVKIGNLTLPNNLVLAPMAGVTDGSFRLLCARMGAGYTVSELASSKAISIGNKQSINLIRFQAQARPYAAQIFGPDPEIMATAAARIEELGVCDAIDINMGCPVAKVVKTGAGSALMKTPELAAKIVKAVSAAVSLPVTIKCRIGWTENSINVRDFVKSCLDAGAKAITVHARTREAGYTGQAKWEHLEGLGELCQDIPFFANGDISEPEHLKQLAEISGCSGFMIGRGCVGRPWIFAELCGNNKFDNDLYKFKALKAHLLDMMMEHGPRAVPLFRVHLFGYLKSHPHAAKLRKALCEERDPAKVISTAENFFCS